MGVHDAPLNRCGTGKSEPARKLGFHLAIVPSVLLLLILISAPGAGAGRSNFVGIAQGPSLDGQDLRGMAAARVGMDRFLLSWRSVEATQNSYRWGRIDKIVGDLASHGIQPLPFLWGSPEWVRPGPSRPPVGGPFAEQVWREFLRAAVARYGPGGTYWANGYRARFPAATPLPIRIWQIWNEPNCTTYFDPGQTVGHAARQYALLLQISHDAIASRDPQARIVLAGLLRYCNVSAWDFINGLYTVPGFKGDFDAAALHPYAGDLGQFQSAIEQFRGVMAYRGDAATPLWLTEFGWGSAPPDGSGINRGPSGQRQMLIDSFRLLLSHRGAWNLRRAYWFFWRDPAPWSIYADACKWCHASGLLYSDRTPKPAYYPFKTFATNTTPP
jgi:Glycosyl hydrolase catalytic core